MTDTSRLAGEGVRARNDVHIYARHAGRGSWQVVVSGARPFPQTLWQQTVKAKRRRDALAIGKRWVELQNFKEKPDG